MRPCCCYCYSSGPGKSFRWAPLCTRMVNDAAAGRTDAASASVTELDFGCTSRHEPPLQRDSFRTVCSIRGNESPCLAENC